MGRLLVSWARPLTSDPHPGTLTPLGARCGLPASWASILGCRGRRDDGEAPRPGAAWGYLDSARPPLCGALRWRGRSHPLPLQPPLPLLLLLSHAEHMVRDPRFLKSQRSSPCAAAWPHPSVFLRVRH